MASIFGMMAFAIPAFGQTALTADCATITDLTIDKTVVELPTNGAKITSAAEVDAAGDTPAFCQLTGEIAPVDPTAPPITFQVNLPLSWNNKAVHFGGGGMNGSLVTGLGNVPGTPDEGLPIARPIDRGYVTFGSDGGHTGTDAFDGSFAVNEEALHNFFGDQLHKTRDVADFLVNMAYGAPIQTQYFAGGSQGGHEGFIVIQERPELYDGVIAYYPVVNYTGAILSQLQTFEESFGTEGGWLPPETQAMVQTHVLRTCDALDGAEDGLISDAMGCEAVIDLSDLACEGDPSPACLSPAQLATVQEMADPDDYDLTLHAGVTNFGSWPVKSGAELWPQMGQTEVLGEAIIGRAGQNFVQYFVLADPEWSGSAATFDEMEHKERWEAISADFDSLNADLSAFHAAGGKVLWLHGEDDFFYPPSSSRDYWARISQTLGEDALRDFARLYLVPGYNHGFGKFNVSWDSLSVLEDWVENGEAPAENALVVTDANGGAEGRTRPLCDYPAWPKYSGSGSMDDAASFICAR
ncbi:MAG: tannase/feruloyl esterase family alpha/beta hydrolase [Maritimibacter sp.]